MGGSSVVYVGGASPAMKAISTVLDVAGPLPARAKFRLVRRDWPVLIHL